MSFSRSRHTPKNLYKSNTYILNSSGVVTTKTPQGNIQDGVSEYIVDDDHLWPPPKRFRGIQTDFGGPVQIHRTETFIYPQVVTAITPPSPFRRGVYKDNIILWNYVNGPPGVNTSIPFELSDARLLAEGIKAWHATKPTAMKGGLGQALGELRELPTLPKVKALRDALSKAPSVAKAKKLAQESGGNYLNIMFGWVPLVKDAVDLVENIQKADKRLAQLIRDNGKGVRRRKDIGGGGSSSSVVTTGNGSNYADAGLFPPLGASAILGNWTKTVHTQTTYDYKFSARFRYHIPFQPGKPMSKREKARMARILFGNEVSPYVAYQLLPWSWLLDWFVSVGDNFKNIHDIEDNLVADYAYINGKSTTVITTTVQISFNGDDAGSRTFVHEQKFMYFRRMSASPFGFGLSFSGFSPYQQAILAALGLSRLR